MEERDGGLVGPELRHAAGAGRQVALERLVHPWRQLMLDEVGQQTDQVLTLPYGHGLAFRIDPREPSVDDMCQSRVVDARQKS